MALPSTTPSLLNNSSSKVTPAPLNRETPATFDLMDNYRRQFDLDQRILALNLALFTLQQKINAAGLKLGGMATQGRPSQEVRQQSETFLQLGEAFEQKKAELAQLKSELANLKQLNKAEIEKLNASKGESKGLTVKNLEEIKQDAAQLCRAQRDLAQVKRLTSVRPALGGKKKTEVRRLESEIKQIKKKYNGLINEQQVETFLVTVNTENSSDAKKAQYISVIYHALYAGETTIFKSKKRQGIGELTYNEMAEIAIKEPDSRLAKAFTIYHKHSSLIHDETNNDAVRKRRLQTVFKSVYDHCASHSGLFSRSTNKSYATADTPFLSRSSLIIDRLTSGFMRGVDNSSPVIPDSDLRTTPTP